MTCNRCGAEGTTFGHVGFCGDCYGKHRAHQIELREQNLENRELLAARIVHPAGKGPKQRARDLWIQKRDPETGWNTA